LLVVTAVAAAFLALTPGIAAAAGSSSDDGRVSISGPVAVGPNVRVDGPVISVDGSVVIAGTVDGDVLVVHGSAVVLGRVTGAVTVVSGDVAVSGRVGDNVTALRGQITLARTAVVHGDVRSSDRPVVASGARVTGTVEKTDFSAWFTAAGWIALFLWWVAVTITLFVIGILLVMLFPRAARTTVGVGRSVPGTVAIWGAILGLGLPAFIGVLAATVIALPLALVGVLALVLAFPLGYVVTSFLIGRMIAKSAHDVVAFIVGFAILRALALIPGLGWLIGFLAAAYGIGALAVNAWRTGHPREEATPGATPGAAPTPEPPEPPAPPASPEPVV
jgi:cytoskeletal protein CcmA (bactofilin family)